MDLLNLPIIAVLDGISAIEFAIVSVLLDAYIGLTRRGLAKRNEKLDFVGF